MKKSKIYILLLLFFLSIGCNEDFLNKKDLDNITSDSFWKTSNDLDLFVTQFYGVFPGYSPNAFNGGIYWDDANSDNIADLEINDRLAGLLTNNAGNGHWNFSTLRSLNTMLAKYPEMDVPFSEISHFVGEAYFFRAYYYFRLLKNFGDVPWVDKPLNPDSEELYNAQTPRREVVEHILSDLDKSIEYLNPGHQSNGNRLNKQIGILFKAHVALYEGTWEKYHQGTVFGVEGSNGEMYLKLAAETSSALISNPGGFGIYNTGKPMVDYWNVFNQVDYSGHPEVMLWRQFDRSLGIVHNGQRYLPRQGGGKGLSKALIDQYLCTDGQPIATSELYMGDRGILKVAENRDPRLSQTVWLPGQVMEVQNGQPTIYFTKAPLGVSGLAGCTTGYMIRKGANTDYEHSGSINVGTTSSPAFRFAEILLIYAEAKAELGTITQADLDISINKLRERAGMPNLELANITQDPNWSFPGLSPIINEVRRERQVELASEGYRLDDIMRWAAADELIIGKRIKGAYFMQEEFPELKVGKDVILDAEGYVDPHSGQVPNGYQFDVNRDYLLPVPRNQITLNPNLQQNPGWEL